MTRTETPKQARPFLAGQRHDVMRELVAGRNQLIEQQIVSAVSRALDPEGPKLDGKGGAVDGTIGIVTAGGIAAFVPICGAYPGPKIEHPKRKDDKESKEQKDSKEGKEGKEQKDSKEGKEGKESKDSKEGKEGKETKEGKEGKEQKDSKEGKEGKESKDSKEDKDSSDGFKTGGTEATDPFTRFGDEAVLPVEAFNSIAREFPEKLQVAIERGAAVF